MEWGLRGAFIEFTQALFCLQSQRETLTMIRHLDFKMRHIVPLQHFSSRRLKRLPLIAINHDIGISKNQVKERKVNKQLERPQIQIKTRTSPIPSFSPHFPPPHLPYLAKLPPELFSKPHPRTRDLTLLRPTLIQNPQRHTRPPLWIIRGTQRLKALPPRQVIFQRPPRRQIRAG